MKILVADDDTSLTDVLSYGLRRRGYTVISAAEGKEALEHWRLDDPRLLIVDVRLPDISGLEVCRQIREKSLVPIIVISGSTNEEDIIDALETGADEYVPKPFSIHQMALRIEALARRARASNATEFEGNVEVGDLVINPEFCSVKHKGEEVRLTSMEFRIVYSLAANAGKIVVTDRLADFAWQGIGEGDPALLKTHISRIRRKLGIASGEPGYIRATPGLGYTLTV